MEDNSIRIGHLKIIDHLILGVCDLSLKKNKTRLFSTRLKTQAMRSWDQVTDSLVSGEIHGAFLPAPIAMTLFGQGLDIQILMFAHRSGSMLVKTPGPSADTLDGFKGKTILVPSALSVQTMLLHRFFSSAGISFGAHDNDGADVVFEAVPPDLMIRMLAHDQDGDIAGFAVSEPFAGIGIQKGLVQRLCTSASLWKDHPCCVFAVHRDYIENNLEAVKELLSLFARTGRQIEDGLDDSILTLAREFLEQDTELIRQAVSRTGIRFAPDLLVPDIRALEIIQNYMADTMKVLKRKIDISLLANPSLFSNLLQETSSEN